MGQVIVRKLDDAVITAHKQRARARGVSLEQQLRDVLAEAARPSREELIADLRRIRAMTSARAPPRQYRPDPRGPGQPMKLVVDASVAIKWMIDEQDSELADRLLDEGHDFLAPELIIAEMISAAWKQRRLGGIGDAQYDDIVARARNGPIAYRPLRPLAAGAAALARALDHPIYDCFYLALAEAEGVPLVTADRRLVAALAGTSLEGRVRPLA